ncbi:MAG: hypothetical protein KIT27_05415 [Legionellales bacterium]|nr:hypothetical protein [Legionellales bacterium]
MKTFLSIIVFSFYCMMLTSYANSATAQLDQSAQRMSDSLLKNNPYAQITLPKELVSLAQAQCECAKNHPELIQQLNKIPADSCLLTLPNKIYVIVEKLAKNQTHPEKYRQALLAKMILASKQCDIK